LHHLCFRCDNLESQVPALQNRGATFVVQPEPGEAFNNNDIAFFVKNHLNVELIDTEEKAGWVKEL
jgi:methylmalonyl-CoA/ethylmalonyl-CoA epimerase